MYVVWDDQNNCCVGLPCGLRPEDSTENWLPLILPPARTSTVQTMKFELIDGSVVGEWVGSPDPLDNPASADEIKARHRELEIMPVMVFGTLLDADERSEKRIQDASEAFDDLPLTDRVVEIGGTRYILWKNASNEDTPLDKLSLSAVLIELKKQRAIRATRLFDELQAFKVNGCSLRDLQDWV